MAADPLTSATVDGVLNFDSTDDEDPFNDKPSHRTHDDKTTLSPGPSKRKAADDFDDALGLKSEVKIAKTRKPIAKLDEARLLSAPGIPKLRADARAPNFLTKKLQIKGKGHEFSDVARILSYYQLWLDDLYPRAKFADGLQLVEKAGHSRRMQIMRKEWIDEGKPGYIREREARKKAAEEGRQAEDEMFAGDEQIGNDGENEAPKTGTHAEVDDSLFIPDSRVNENAENDDAGLPEDDELDALLAEQETSTARRPSSAPKRTVEDDSDGEDDLDALLAEQDTRRAPAPETAPNSAPNLKPSPFEEEDDEDMDDLDALLAEQDARSKSDPTQHVPGGQPLTVEDKPSSTRHEDEDLIDEDDDLDALIVEQEARQGLNNESPLPSPASVKTSVLTRPGVDEEVAAADGADIFSSSPVRGIASSRLPHAEEAGHEVELPDFRPGSRSGLRHSMQAGDVREGKHEQVKEAGLQVREEQEEESQGHDAGDMFSSSPVQND